MTQPTHGQPCPGRCNRTWRTPASIVIEHDDQGAPVSVHLDEHHQPIPFIAGQPVWCRPCQDPIRHALHQVIPLTAQLLLREDGHLNAGRDTNTTRTGTRTGSPSGSPAWDTVDQTAAWVQDWRDELAQHLGHSRRLHPATSKERNLNLARNVRYLTEHLTALLSWDDRAVAFGITTPNVVAGLERAAGMDRLRHRLPAPCPSCDRRALARDDGDEQVVCGACKRTWVEDDYRRLTVVLASELAG